MALCDVAGARAGRGDGREFFVVRSSGHYVFPRHLPQSHLIDAAGDWMVGVMENMIVHSHEVQWVRWEVLQRRIPRMQGTLVIKLSLKIT